MTYTKPMIDLIREIRRRVPVDAKPSIKLANPEILDELLVLYRNSSDNIFKALVRDLMSMAGGDWSSRLESTAQSSFDDGQGRLIARVYRGQTSLVEALSAKGESPADDDSRRQERRKRVYRGQVIG